MPKRTDIKSILLIGSGPIVIGQACELDNCCTQACRTLLVNHCRPMQSSHTSAAITGPSGPE